MSLYKPTDHYCSFSTGLKLAHNGGPCGRTSYDIFAPNGRYFVYYPLNLFSEHMQFRKLGSILS